jgi:hypothetical protein
MGVIIVIININHITRCPLHYVISLKLLIYNNLHFSLSSILLNQFQSMLKISKFQNAKKLTWSSDDMHEYCFFHAIKTKTTFEVPFGADTRMLCNGTTGIGGLPRWSACFVFVLL